MTIEYGIFKKRLGGKKTHTDFVLFYLYIHIIINITEILAIKEAHLTLSDKGGGSLKMRPVT